MGLTVREMLKSSAFADYKLVAGRAGLDNQIQGVAVVDAPDALRFTEGKELVISAGYLFKLDENLIHEFLEMDSFKKVSCMGIKTRFIGSFSDDVLEKFDALKIPLVIIPERFSWMDIINALNVQVMNKNIRQFNIGSINPRNFSNLTYQGRKIDKILSQMEMELSFPAMLYDLSNEKSYYSSKSFIKLTEGLEIDDFWTPSFCFTTEILCDNLNMIRYRFTDDKYDRPYSWITIPIKVGNKVKAYFVLVEATDLIDYFDQFSIRIGFLLIQSLYEQMTAIREIEDAGFQKLILDIISGYLSNDEDINRRALELDVFDENRYFMLLMKQENHNIEISELKGEIRKALSTGFEIEGFRAAFVDANSLVFLLPIINPSDEKLIPKIIDREILKLKERLESRIPGTTYTFGLSDHIENIYGTKRNFERAEQTINMGRVLFQDEIIIKYSQLGPFAWMKLDDEEVKLSKNKIDQLLNQDGTGTLIETLKNYLKFNMNYSVTAKSMFIHINTVRKRVEQITDILDMDLSNPANRLNLEILLKLIY